MEPVPLPPTPPDAGASVGSEVALQPPPPAPVVPPEDQQFYNEVILAAKSQAEKDAKVVKYFTNLFKYGEFKEGEGASANFTFSDISLLMSILYARDPNIVVMPENVGMIPAFDVLVQMGMLPDSGTGHRMYAEVLERVEDFIWRDTKSATHINSALFGSLVTGMGAVKTSFDAMKGCSRIDTLLRDELYIDPAARYNLTQAEYVCQCCVKTAAEAQLFFQTLGAQYVVKANFNLANSSTTIGGDMAKVNEPKAESQRYFRFYEIWVKKPTGERKVYYRDYAKDEWIHSCDWPYIFDLEDFPYSLLVFNQQFQQVMDAFTDLETINGIRIAYENIIEFYRRHIFKGIATKILYDKSCFPDDTLSAFLDGDDLKALPVEAMGQRSIDQVVTKLNMTEDASVIIELAASLKALKDEIFGISDIQRGTSKKEYTATQSNIQDKWGSQRLDRRQSILDAFLEDILLKRTQIDLLLAPSEKIQRIVGQQGQMLWDLFDGDIEQLRCQYTISVAAGSTGQDAKQQKIESIERAFKLMTSVNQTQPMPAFDVVGLAKELLELYELPHPERFILGPVMPKDAGVPGAAPPGGDPNAPAAQGAHGAPPTGQPPPETMPGESEPGAPMNG